MIEPEEIRVLLADDDDIYRENLALLLNDADGIRVVATAGNGAQAISEIAKHLVDVALLDVDMPVLDGIATAGAIEKTNPSVTVVILTAFEHEESLASCLEKNVSGFLTKDTPVEQLALLIRQAHRGKQVISGTPTELLTQTYLRNHQSQLQYRDFIKRTETLPEHLKPVLKLVAQALPNKEIAKTLSLSESTVKSYVSDILTHTNCATRGELSLCVIRSGILERNAN